MRRTGMAGGAALAACAMCGLVASAVFAGAEKVTFPTDYRTTFTYWMTSERYDNNQVRYLWANAAAFGAAADSVELPHGSQFAMEVYSAKVDADGEPILNADGQLMPDRMKLVAVMEKGEGWGAAYPEEERNGDWEYAFFTPEGELMADVDTAPCRACHLPYADEDFVINRGELDAAAGK